MSLLYKQYKILEENNIKFNKIDSNSAEGQLHMEKADAKGIPLLLFNDKYTIGYNDLTSLNNLGINNNLQKEEFGENFLDANYNQYEEFSEYTAVEEVTA